MTHVRTSPFHPQSNGKPACAGRIDRWPQSRKAECLRPGVALSLDDARRLVGQYVDYYNTIRLHSALGCVGPVSRWVEQWGGRTAHDEPGRGQIAGRNFYRARARPDSPASEGRGRTALGGDPRGGAIASAISQGLLERGCHVAVTDLPGENMASLIEESKSTVANRVPGVAEPSWVARRAGRLGGPSRLSQTQLGIIPTLRRSYGMIVTSIFATGFRQSCSAGDKSPTP